MSSPTAAKSRSEAEQARRERGEKMWPEPDGMATLSAYLPAAETPDLRAQQGPAAASLVQAEQNVCGQGGEHFSAGGTANYLSPDVDHCFVVQGGGGRPGGERDVAVFPTFRG